MDSRREESRRAFIQRAAYVAPTIVTLHAVPAFASHGSANAQTREKGNNGVGNGWDPQPPGNPSVNDGLGATPGNPGRGGGSATGPGGTGRVGRGSIG
jgi:hypothetical protein